MKKISISIVTILFFILSNIAFGIKSSDTIKIGVINISNIYQSVPQGKTHADNIQKTLQPKLIELQKQQSNLINKIQELQKKSPALTNSTLNDEQNHLQLEQEEIKEKAMFLQKEEQKINDSFQESLIRAVKTIAEKNKYQIILTTQSVAYATTEILNDKLTKDIIELMNITYYSIR